MFNLRTLWKVKNDPWKAFFEPQLQPQTQLQPDTQSRLILEVKQMPQGIVFL